MLWPLNWIWNLSTQRMRHSLNLLIKPKGKETRKGAEFASPLKYRGYLSPFNEGLLLDGYKLALSEQDSFQNVCVIARVGAGKTSRYIIPNVLFRAEQKCSMVVNDPKGEVYGATSSYLKSLGYRLIVVSPDNPEHSSRFNPLLEAKNDVELDQIAEIIMKAGSADKKDEFWTQNAMRYVSLFLRCLRNVTFLKFF